MKKSEILKIAINIVFLSIIAKILSMIVRIIIARYLSNDAMTLYTLALPSMSLFITIAQLSLPTITTKIFADKTKKKQKPFTALVIIALINNLLLFIILCLFIPIISFYFFKNTNMDEVLKSLIPLLPIVTISGILKGYYQGKQHYREVQTALIIEEITRLSFILIISNNLNSQSPTNAAALAIHSITVGEIGTLSYLFIMLPLKKNKIDLLLQKTEPKYVKSILETSIPISASRLFTTFTSFLEPIIISYQINATSINQFYGAIHGYIFPLIMIPNFLSSSLSFYLLPSFINSVSSNNLKHAKKLLLTTITFTLSISISYALFLTAFPNIVITLIYNKDLTEYITLLRLLVIPLSLCSIQGLLSACLIGINKARQAFLDSLCGNICKLLILFFFLPSLNEYALILSLLICSFITTILHLLRIYFAVFHNH